MGDKSLRRLKQTLNDWANQGLISWEQCQAIEAYEAKRPQVSWILYGFMSLGVAVLAIGIVSLIAANWRDIPGSIKLSLDFCILIALAIAVIYAWKRQRPMLYEALLSLFLLLCLASIGLISQVFHTGGELYMALLFWSAITFALSLAAQKSFVPFLWASLFILGFALFLLDGKLLHHLFYQRSTITYLILPLFCLLLAVIFQHSKRFPMHLNALRQLSLITGLIGLVVVESGLYGRSGNYHLNYFMFSYIFAALGLLLILLNPHYRKIQKWILCCIIAIYLFLFHLPSFGISSDLIYAILSVVLLISVALYFASIKSRKLFNLFILLAGLRVLIVYFQALGGLAYTGVGLILSGLLILTSVWLWQRYRQPLQNWTEGFTA